MKKDNIDYLEILKSKNLKTKKISSQDGFTLYVEGDENDGDDISETFNFKLDEYEEVIEAYKFLLEFKGDKLWRDRFEKKFPKKEEREAYIEKIDLISDYVPTTSLGYVHSIYVIALSAIIDGVEYEINLEH